MNFTTEIAPYTILDLNKDTDYPLEQLIHTLPIVILWAMVKSKTLVNCQIHYTCLCVLSFLMLHFFFKVMDIYKFIFCLNNSVSSAREISKQTQHLHTQFRVFHSCLLSSVGCLTKIIPEILVTHPLEVLRKVFTNVTATSVTFSYTFSYIHSVTHNTDKTLNYNTYNFEFILTSVPVFKLTTKHLQSKA